MAARCTRIRSPLPLPNFRGDYPHYRTNQQGLMSKTSGLPRPAFPAVGRCSGHDLVHNATRPLRRELLLLAVVDIAELGVVEAEAI